MILNISISGNGSQISKVTINGKPSQQAIIPNDAFGAQSIMIEL